LLILLKETKGICLELTITLSFYPIVLLGLLGVCTLGQKVFLLLNPAFTSLGLLQEQHPFFITSLLTSAWCLTFVHRLELVLSYCCNLSFRLLEKPDTHPLVQFKQELATVSFDDIMKPMNRYLGQALLSLNKINAALEEEDATIYHSQVEAEVYEKVPDTPKLSRTGHLHRMLDMLKR